MSRRSHLVVKSLTHGSWSGNIVNRNPPRGGGGSFDQSVGAHSYLSQCHDALTLVTWLDFDTAAEIQPLLAKVIFVAWLIHTCDMTHSHVWHDSVSIELLAEVIRVELLRMKWLNSFVWHDSFTRVTWLICDTTHTCESCLDLNIEYCQTWLTHTCDMCDLNPKP